MKIPTKKYAEESATDDWHFPAFDAVYDGSERILETYERTCVENNAGHGRVSVLGKAPR